MPQLDIEFWPPQLIWLFLTFTALYFIMMRIVLPRIATVIEQRDDRIANNLDDAQRLKKETENSIIAYEEALATARAKANDIIAQNHDQLHVELDEERARIKETIAAHIKESDNKIKAMRNAALHEINIAASDVTEMIVCKLTDMAVSKDDIAGIVNTLQKAEEC